MAGLAIFGILAFAAYTDGIVMQHTITTMGHGQHKKKKRSSTFKVGNQKPHKALSPMSAADVSAAAALAGEHSTRMVKDALSAWAKNVSGNVGQDIAEAVRVMGKYELMDEGPNSEAAIPYRNKTNRIVPKLGMYPVTVDVDRAAEMTGGNPWAPSPLGEAAYQNYLSKFSAPQLAWLVSNGYMDRYFRFNDEFLLPPLKAIYDFFRNTQVQNDEIAEIKYKVISIFCSVYAISTCPFLPGSGDKSDVYNSQMLANDGAGEGDLRAKGSFPQQEGFEQMLLTLLRTQRARDAPPILREHSISPVDVDQELLEDTIFKRRAHQTAATSRKQSTVPQNGKYHAPAAHHA